MSPLGWPLSACLSLPSFPPFGMASSQPRSTVSRRSRPAKAPLSREAIVKAGLRLLDKHGLEGLSMRKVAAALDTGAASLYVYVKDLDELHGLMLDKAFEDVTAPDSGTWKAQLKGLLESYFGVLMRRPALAQLAMSTVPSGRNTMRCFELILRLLAKGGITGRKAFLGADFMLLNVTAVAAEQAMRRFESKTFERVSETLHSLSPEEFPHIVASRDLLKDEGQDRFQWALDAMIQGVISAPGK